MWNAHSILACLIISSIIFGRRSGREERHDIHYKNARFCRIGAAGIPHVSHEFNSFMTISIVIKKIIII